MRRQAALTIAALALVLVPAAALATPAANDQTFSDARNEDPAAPDIAAVRVTNDDAGLITFTTEIPNRPALTPDMVVLSFLDTTPGAGDALSLGADWAIQHESIGATLFRWNGTDYVVATPQSTLTSTYTATGARVAIDASELGEPKTIGFATIAISGISVDASGNPDLTNAHRDVAPDAGFYSYEVKTTFSLKSTGFAITPTAPRAGGPFSVGLAATQSDTGSAVRQGTVDCRATVGGATLRVASRRVVSGVAACVWSLPSSAAGKTVRGTITLTVQGTKLRKSFTARVR